MLVKIKVDDIEIKVNKNKNLIYELKKHSINIPHFCYHPQMGVEGNCRMCLIELKGAKRPQIACDTPIKENMEIFTKSASVKKLREAILELEFINHPLDCSVCDQVGECSLQEYYMDYDLQPSRMKVAKVDKEKHLNYGNGIIHDQERCVLCTRCVRFTKTISKTDELGVIKRGDTSAIAVFPNIKTKNRYSQNIVDVCPVGAMTSEDFRFKRRVYFLKTANSICHGCSKGCNIYIDHEKKKYAKNDLIYRFRPRVNENINNHFMCDDGRYSYKLENKNTLEFAFIKNKKVSDIKAINQAKEYLKNAIFLISPNCNLEEMSAIKSLAKEVNAKLSGFSESYIRVGDGDDYLIQDDKSANRNGLKILEISQDFNELKKYLNSCENIFIFNSKAMLACEELLNLTKDKNIININSKENELVEISNINIPCSSFSQKSGTIINCDNIVQKYERAIISQRMDLVDIISEFLGKEVDLDIDLLMKEK